VASIGLLTVKTDLGWRVSRGKRARTPARHRLPSGNGNATGFAGWAVERGRAVSRATRKGDRFCAHRVYHAALTLAIEWSGGAHLSPAPTVLPYARIFQRHQLGGRWPFLKAGLAPGGPLGMAASARAVSTSTLVL
jgi:hypothetical protein